MKGTPKSCSCSACKRGKGAKRGGHMLKMDERAFRHGQKIALNKGSEVSVPAPIGNYYD